MKKRAVALLVTLRKRANLTVGGSASNHRGNEVCNACWVKNFGKTVREATTGGLLIYLASAANDVPVLGVCQFGKEVFIGHVGEQCFDSHRLEQHDVRSTGEFPACGVSVASDGFGDILNGYFVPCHFGAEVFIKDVGGGQGVSPSFLNGLLTAFQPPCYTQRERR